MALPSRLNTATRWKSATTSRLVATGATTSWTVQKELLAVGAPLERYGAKGDGVTDDTAAVLAAAAAARADGTVPTLSRGKTYRLARPAYAAWDVAFVNLGGRVAGFPLPSLRPEEAVPECQMHVDAIDGSDGFSGLSPSRPKRTIAAALALMSPGQKLGLARGRLFNEYPGVVPCDNLTICAYGAGSRPVVDGGYRVQTSSWTNTTGSEWSTTGVTTAPGNVFWYASGARVGSELQSGTAGALASGAYAYSGGTLTVNIGGDPRGLLFVVTRYATNIEADYRRGLRLLDLDLRHAASNNVQTKSCDDIAASRCAMFHSGSDNWNCNLASTGMQIRHCEFYYPGQANAGDNFSCHQAGGGTVEQCYMEGPGKDCISNSELGTWDYLQNFFNKGALTIYNDGSGGGTHNAIGNIMKGVHWNATAAPQYALLIGTLATATTVKVMNNTAYRGTAGGTQMRGHAYWGGTLTSRNNVVEGGYQFGVYKNGTPVLDEDYNCVHGAGTTVVAMSLGAHSITSAPQLTDPANDDFRPAAGSPLLAAGQAQAGVIDAFWGAVPNIGAL
jgi:hypothetical protein